LTSRFSLISWKRLLAQPRQAGYAGGQPDSCLTAWLPGCLTVASGSALSLPLGVHDGTLPEYDVPEGTDGTNPVDRSWWESDSQLPTATEELDCSPMHTASYQF
jgi:hypothetical protein